MILFSIVFCWVPFLLDGLYTERSIFKTIIWSNHLVCVPTPVYVIYNISFFMLPKNGPHGRLGKIVIKCIVSDFSLYDYRIKL